MHGDGQLDLRSENGDRMMPEEGSAQRLEE
jgi:hypothetical protein